MSLKLGNALVISDLARIHILLKNGNTISHNINKAACLTRSILAIQPLPKLAKVPSDL